MKPFLGLPVRSRLGIAAGLLLNSRWVSGYAKLGFDILTYKTVRSRARDCYDPPNWVFVHAPEELDKPAYALTDLPDDPSELSSAVCFGMPSMAPEVWRQDVALAKASLRQGQILIVSVVATPGPNASATELADDFRQCAAWAAEAGADVVEANFSCPNVCSAEGTIYMDPILSRQIAQSIRGEIGPVPLLIKVGNLPEEKLMRRLLNELNGIVHGLTLVNGITRPVLNRDDRPVFGEHYVRAGVLGRAIHRPSVEQVRMASRLVKEESLGISLAAVGGVSSEGDIHDFFAAGADAVLMGSSPMYLPDLAITAKKAHPEW